MSIDNERGSNYNKSLSKIMKKNSLLFITILLFLTLVGTIVYILRPETFSFVSFAKPQPTEASSEKSSKFVSVFLTNNQIYFGKISNLDSNYPTLKDVYYLRVQKTLVPADEADTATGVKVEDKKKAPLPQQKDELTLVKLGNELHGPTDEIKFNRDQILYIEDLREDSKVVKAITQYEAKNK